MPWSSPSESGILPERARRRGKGGRENHNFGNATVRSGVERVPTHHGQLKHQVWDKVRKQSIVKKGKPSSSSFSRKRGLLPGKDIARNVDVSDRASAGQRDRAGQGKHRLFERPTALSGRREKFTEGADKGKSYLAADTTGERRHECSAGVELTPRSDRWCWARRRARHVSVA